MNDEILLELYGFKFRTGTLYQVTEKTDSFAPDGFKEYKTSKALHPDVSNIVPGAIFDTELGVWDTGLYENSKALTRAIPNTTERAAFIKNVTKVIVTPLDKLKGKNFLSQFAENNNYWDKFRIDLFKGKLFNTSKPEDLLQLYLAVLHRQLTPSTLEQNPEFKNSQYCIIDKEDSIDRKLEAEMGMMEAQGTFFNLLKSDKKKDLFLILNYLKIGVTENTEDRVLTSLFNNWLKDKTDGYQNYSVFIKAHKFFLTEAGENEIFYHSKIKELIKKGFVKQRKSEIWFEEEFVGSDMKSAVKNILSDAGLQEKILTHIE